MTVTLRSLDGLQYIDGVRAAAIVTTAEGTRSWFTDADDARAFADMKNSQHLTGRAGWPYTGG